MSRTKQITLGLAAGALALGTGLGVTSMASATTTPDPGATSTPSEAATPGQTSGDGLAPGKGHGRHGGPGRDAGHLASALATKLGVDETKVTDALKAFRDANKPAQAPSDDTKPSEGSTPSDGTAQSKGSEAGRPDRAAMEAALAKSLASSLGVEESKVTAALEEIRSEAKSDRAAELKSRLDQAVTDGKLTQAEADAVTKAVEAGVIGGGAR